MAMLLYVDTQFTSPYAMSAFVALRAKDLSFDLLPLDLAAGAHRQPAFAATSITRRIPTLVHDDFWLSESSAIAEYLDDVCPGPALYPANPRHRAQARQVQAWLRSDLMPLRQERSTEVIFFGKRMEPLSEAARDCAEKLCAAATNLLADRDDSLFGTWSIADVDLSLMLNRLVLHGDDVSEPLAAYARRQWSHPAIQEWVGMKRPAP